MWHRRIEILYHKMRFLSMTSRYFRSIEQKYLIQDPLKNAARLSSTLSSDEASSPKSICSCFPRQLLDVCFPTTLCVSGSRQPATRVRRDNTLRLRRFLCPAHHISSFFRGSFIHSFGTSMIFSREANPLMMRMCDFEQFNVSDKNSINALFARPSIGGAAMRIFQNVPFLSTISVLEAFGMMRIVIRIMSL